MNKKLLAALVVILLAAGVASAWQRRSASSSSGTTTGSATATPEQSPNSVAIQGMAFSPATLTVKKGTTVTWTNRDSVSHTVTADQADPNNAPDSATLAPGETYGFTFPKAGTYSYHCAIHPSMKGTVVVTE